MIGATGAAVGAGQRGLGSGEICSPRRPGAVLRRCRAARLGACPWADDARREAVRRAAAISAAIWCALSRAAKGLGVLNWLGERGWIGASPAVTDSLRPCAVAPE